MTAPRSATGSDERPLRVQTRFERFPASIKGAFVMAGADGNPHAIRIEEAQVIRVPGGPVKPIPLEDRQLNVAPSRDLFVPFEVGVMDLEPGWYQLVSSVRVDGGRVWTFEGRPFTIPWARNDVRRGVLPVGKKASAGGIQFEVDRVELTADAAIVVWRVAARGSEEGAEPTARAVLMADGQELSTVPPVPGSRAFEPRQPGEHRSVSYPVPRGARTLEVVIRPNRGKASAPVPVSLL